MLSEINTKSIREYNKRRSEKWFTSLKDCKLFENKTNLSYQQIENIIYLKSYS